MTQNIAISDVAGLRTIAMQRPEKKNALTQAMYATMTQALVSANADPSIRCVLFVGVPGAFSAGNDLEDFLNASKAGQGIGGALDFLHAVAGCTRPMVAAVDGLAVGIGTTLLLHCDYAVASTTSRFSTPFTQLGLVPEAASSLLAPRLMGHRRAFALLAMGRPMDAQAALSCGLVNVVVASAEVEAEARKVAADIIALPAEALAITRRLLRPAVDEVIARIDEEAALFAERMQSKEAVAAFSAFLSRKK